jgi:hypothetical protein
MDQALQPAARLGRREPLPAVLLDAGRQSHALARAAGLLLTLLAAVAVLRGQAGPTDAQLFDDTALQRVELQVNSRDWADLRAGYLENTYYPATFLWGGQIVRNVGIRSRGLGTRNGQKPGLRIDFNRYVTGQHFLGLKALVLDNHLQDWSAMREAITMAVHARLGMPAPREAAAEVFVNGEFFGVYTLVEEVDSVSTRRMFPDTQAAGLVTRRAGPVRRPEGLERRLRGPLDPAPGPSPAPGPTPTPSPSPTPVPETPPGYLFEYHWLDYFFGSYPGPDLTLYIPMFEARTHETESIETLYRPIERLFREINEGSDDSFLSRVGPLLDLRLFIRQAAVEAYMADFDGMVGSFGLNNFYLYRDAAGGPFRFVPWDEDNAFHAVDYPIDADHGRHELMRRAMRVPELAQLFVDTLLKAADVVDAREGGGAAGWMEREVGRRYALIAARMHDDHVKQQTDAEFEDAVAFNVAFARARTAFVRSQIERLQPSRR